MSIHGIIPNTSNLVTLRIAPQFRPVADSARDRPNPVFNLDGASFGSVASPFQTYSASSAFNSNCIRASFLNRSYHADAFTATSSSAVQQREPFDIRNYYTIAEDDVLSKVWEVRQRIRDTDFSSMTDTEAYDWIESQFIEAFGENFLMACRLNVGTQFRDIGLAFDISIRNQFGANHHTINRERLFADMSLDEIHDTIRASYPEKLTYRDLLLMHAEMKSVGMFDGEIGWSAPPGSAGFGVWTLKEDLSTSLATGLQRPWQSMLNEPINKAHIFGLYNAKMWTGRYISTEDNTNFMVRTLGGVLDDRGWLKGGNLPWHWVGGDFDLSNVNLEDKEYVHEIPDLIAQFMETLEEREYLVRERNNEQDNDTNNSKTKHINTNYLQGKGITTNG